MKDEGITVILPVYNEEESIRSTVEQVKRVMANKIQHEIVVVNDGSNDSTKNILEKEEDIILINNAYNLGYGASLKKGIEKAKYPWIFMLDADGTYPVNEMPNLIKYMDKYDMVVGARVGRNINVPFMRRPAKFILTKLAGFLTKKEIPDLNSGMRLFKKEIAMRFFNLFPSGFSFTTTITLACLTNDYTIKYVSIDYMKRKGKSTIRPINDFFGFMILIFKVIVYFEPLRFFTPLGIIFILGGIGYGLYQVLRSSLLGLGQLPIILILAGIQIFFLGIIAEAIAKNK